jgi:hypothetical protein
VRSRLSAAFERDFNSAIFTKCRIFPSKPSTQINTLLRVGLPPRANSVERRAQCNRIKRLFEVKSTATMSEGNGVATTLCRTLHLSSRRWRLVEFKLRLPRRAPSRTMSTRLPSVHVVLLRHEEPSRTVFPSDGRNRDRDIRERNIKARHAEKARIHVLVLVSVAVELGLFTLSFLFWLIVYALLWW